MCRGPAPVDPGNSKGELRPWHSCIPGLNDQYDEEELAKKVKKECTTKEVKNQATGIKIYSGDKIDPGVDVPKRASVIWEVTLRWSPECGT